MLYAFRDSFYELAKKDKRAVIIHCDQEIGLEKMKEEMPGQYFMEGISEANIIGMAAGLASDGYIPYVIGHGSFVTRRVYEQIFVDACFQYLPVRIIGIGTGLASAHLGATHTLPEDLAIMRAIPKMTVIAPCDADEVKRAVAASAQWKEPVYIRLARYGKPVVSRPEDKFEIGKAVLLRKAKEKADVLFISTGSMTAKAVAAAEQLAAEGLDIAVLHVHTVKPLDAKAIVANAKKAKLIVTLEESSLIGGLGSACLEALADNMPLKDVPRLVRMGLPDLFIHDYGTQEYLLDKYELETPHITRKILELVNKGKALIRKGDKLIDKKDV